MTRPPSPQTLSVCRWLTRQSSLSALAPSVRRRLSNLQATFPFEFCDESYASDLGMTRVGGALHADASSAACEPFYSLSCLASEARPVCLCSQPALKTDCGRYKACVAALSFARQSVCPVLAGRYVNGVVGSVQRREWSVVCMHRVR